MMKTSLLGLEQAMKPMAKVPRFLSRAVELSPAMSKRNRMKDSEGMWKTQKNAEVDKSCIIFHGTAFEVLFLTQLLKTEGL